MAAARGNSASTGLGDLNLDTSEQGLGAGAAEERAGGLAGGTADPWARFAEQLDWDELRVAQPAAALEPEPALLPGPSFAGMLPAVPMPAVPLSTGPLPAGTLPTGPLPAGPPPAAMPLPAAPLPATPLPAVPLPAGPLPAGPVAAPAVAAQRAPAKSEPPAPREVRRDVPPSDPLGSLAAASTGLASPAVVDLPTEPSLQARPAAGPRAQWRARAQELGLYSVFLAAADDFGSAAQPVPAPEPVTPPAAPETSQLAPAEAPAETASPLPPAAPPVDSAQAATVSVASAVASADPPPLPDVAPPAPPDKRLLGASRPTGSLLNALRRPVTQSGPLAPAQPAPTGQPAQPVPTGQPAQPVPTGQPAPTVPTGQPAPEPVATAPVTPVSSRLLGAPHRAGSLLGAVNRAVPKPPAPPPAAAPASPSRTGLLVAEAIELFKKSVAQGRSLLQQFLSGYAAAQKAKAPPPPPAAPGPGAD